MKTTVHTGSKPKPYPCIRVSIRPNSKDLTVLFTSEETGVVLDPGACDTYKVGQTVGSWVNSEDPEYWVLGSITLSSL